MDNAKKMLVEDTDWYFERLRHATEAEIAWMTLSPVVQGALILRDSVHDARLKRIAEEERNAHQ